MKASHFISAALAGLALVLAAPAIAQSNDDDYTPLNSRIKRDRQFPTDLFYRFDPSTWSDVQKDRSKEMMGQFSRCLWRRSNTKSLDLLEKTDLGFMSFEQIGQDNDKAARILGISDCLRRVAESQNSGLMMRWTVPGIRQSLLREAYFDKYPERPDWVRPGYVIDERTLPLSGNNPSILFTLDLADCMVAADPYSVDLYFRTASGSPLESEVLQELIPHIGPCLPQGMQMEIDRDSLRVWLGEGLWHAANHSSPAPPEPVGEQQ
ncbi:MAG TPA: hypothetical protein VLA37_00040 [Sphingomonadaceae bacterium]|nr:hypothetical protein [Sphingomonadaceae bacterium]